MYKLFTDKPELFECDIKIQGASLKKSKARLVVETQGYSLLFEGSISEDGRCKVPIRKLKGLIDESSKGNIRLEVIAEDTFFTPWSSDFEIEASKKVTVEVITQASKKVIKENKISISNIKNEVTNEVTNEDTSHVVNILKLLIRENISLDNLSLKKVRVNKIIATYIKHKPITEATRKGVIKGVLKELYKK